MIHFSITKTKDFFPHPQRASDHRSRIKHQRHGGQTISLPYIFYWLFLLTLSSDEYITTVSIANSSPLEEKPFPLPVSSPVYYRPSYFLITPFPPLFLEHQYHGRQTVDVFYLFYCWIFLPFFSNGTISVSSMSYNSVVEYKPLPYPKSSPVHYHSWCLPKTPSLPLLLRTTASWKKNLLCVLSWILVFLFPILSWRPYYHHLQCWLTQGCSYLIW